MKTNQIITATLVGITACTGAVLASSTIYADNDSAVDQITITVPTACTMSGNVVTGQEHSAELTPGTYSGASGSTYENGIGKTTLTTYCNDNNGFSIYAIGFTSNTEGDNTLVGTSASGNATIATKVYESTDTSSNWSMKVTKVTDTTQSYNPNNMTVTNSFNTWHTVPDDYTKVAEYKSTTEPATTDTTLGAKLETTYATYIATAQPADIYTGQVKYVMVHPYDHTAPEKIVSFNTAFAEAGKTKMNDYYVIQDTTPSICNAVSMGQTTEVIDSRDDTVYHIGKLADGKCWLLDNLALDLTDSTILNSLSSSNTNIDSSDETAILTSLKNGNRSAGNQYATAGIGNLASGNSFSEPRANLAYKNTIPQNDDDPLKDETLADSWKTGGYYNYCAASAGSYCYGDGKSHGTHTSNATSSICPKNWRLPTGGTSGEQIALYNEYSTYADYRSAFRLPLSGMFGGDGSPHYHGTEGSWWSSTWGSQYYMYSFHIYKSTIYPTYLVDLINGFSVRCILDL